MNKFLHENARIHNWQPKKTRKLATFISLSLLSSASLANPIVEGDDIVIRGNSPAGWYQIQKASGNYDNVCQFSWNPSSGGEQRCEVAESGSYNVINHTTGERYENVQVDISNNSSSTNSQPPQVSNGRISWTSSGYFQVQNVNNLSGSVCEGSNIRHCDVAAGTYIVINHSTGERWENLIVTGNNDNSNTQQENPDENNDSTTTTSSQYREIFRDDFNGNNVSSQFFLANWAIPGRATTNSLEACSQSGGKLNLAVRNAGSDIQSCYLISNKRDIGPGDDTTIKIEYVANVSKVRALGAWFAGWVFPLGEGNPATDNNPATGAEYDVFEYMPTNPTEYNTALHDGSSSAEWITYAKHGTDFTQDQYHTFSMEWNKDCVVYSFNGTPVNKISDRISKEPVHSIYLTMEGETGRQWDTAGWEGWYVGDLANNLTKNDAIGKIDMVRVLQKDEVDSSLCNTNIRSSNAAPQPTTNNSSDSNTNENWSSDTTSASSNSGVCTVAGNNFGEALAAYASQCSLPREDCDPVDGKWYCSSANVGANPVVTTPAAPTAQEEFVTLPVEPDTTAPTITYSSPGSNTGAGAVSISGKVQDDSGILLVRALLVGRDLGNQRYNFATGKFSTSTVYADTVKTVGLSNKSGIGADWSFTIPNLAAGDYRLRTKVWDNASNASTWFVYDFTVTSSVSERAFAMRSAMDALESYQDVHGTYRVANSGWRGNGAGWFFYDQGVYPNSVADALSSAGHLVIHTDPLHVNSSRVVGDFLIYQCKDKAALFSRHGTGQEITSTTDKNWWNSNGCPRHPLDQLNANYFILSK